MSSSCVGETHATLRYHPFPFNLFFFFFLSTKKIISYNWPAQQLRKKYVVSFDFIDTYMSYNMWMVWMIRTVDAILVLYGAFDAWVCLPSLCLAHRSWHPSLCLAHRSWHPSVMDSHHNIQHTIIFNWLFWFRWGPHDWWHGKAFDFVLILIRCVPLSHAFHFSTFCLILPPLTNIKHRHSKSLWPSPLLIFACQKHEQGSPSFIASAVAYELWCIQYSLIEKLTHSYQGGKKTKTVLS